VTLSALASVVCAQRFRRGYAPAVDQPLVGEPKEWTFARLAYDGTGFRGGGSWSVDYPYAEYHFSQAVDRLTRIDVYPDGHVISPDSDDLFNYPWLYAVEVGYWTFSDSQAAPWGLRAGTFALRSLVAVAVVCSLIARSSQMNVVQTIVVDTSFSATIVSPSIICSATT